MEFSVYNINTDYYVSYIWLMYRVSAPPSIFHVYPSNIFLCHWDFRVWQKSSRRRTQSIVVQRRFHMIHSWLWSFRLLYPTINSISYILFGLFDRSDSILWFSPELVNEKWVVWAFYCTYTLLFLFPFFSSPSAIKNLLWWFSFFFILYTRIICGTHKLHKSESSWK